MYAGFPTEALRPLDIDAGKYERAQYGYRVHTAMMTFAWSAKTVSTKIRELPRRDAARAQRAYDYLMSQEASAYKDFIERHRAFRRRHSNAKEKDRKRPLRFIEEQGIECALWPHLYWRTEMCETYCVSWASTGGAAIMLRS